jgi:hypothetical protein
MYDVLALQMLPQAAGCLKTQKNGRMRRWGEYKIRPYKGFPGVRSGSACILCSPVVLRQPPQWVFLEKNPLAARGKSNFIGILDKQKNSMKQCFFLSRRATGKVERIENLHLGNEAVRKNSSLSPAG